MVRRAVSKLGRRTRRIEKLEEIAAARRPKPDPRLAPFSDHERTVFFSFLRHSLNPDLTIKSEAIERASEADKMVIKRLLLALFPQLEDRMLRARSAKRKLDGDEAVGAVSPLSIDN